MMNMMMARVTPRPLTRQVRGGVSGWTIDGLAGGMPVGVSFTRASGGGYFNASGLWTVTGSDAARFDHTPTTFAPRGLLIEGQRTNLLLWNRDLTNAAWTKTSMTASKVATGIDGASNSASRLTATSNNGTALQAVTSGSALRATSAYVRRVSGSGTVEMTQNGGTNWTAITLTSSWQRFGPAGATVTNPSVGFRLGTSGDVIEVDYVQLENGAFASSAIGTTSASATRAADVVRVSNLATLGFNPTEGTLLVEFEMMGIVTGQQQRAMEFNNGTNSNLMGLTAHNAGFGAAARLLVATSGVTVADISAGGTTAGVVYKVAGAYKQDDFAVVRTGGSVGTDTSGSIPPVDRLYVGDSIASNRQLYGWLRSLAYWPTRLPNEQLQALVQ